MRALRPRVREGEVSRTPRAKAPHQAGEDARLGARPPDAHRQPGVRGAEARGLDAAPKLPRAARLAHPLREDDIQRAWSLHVAGDKN